MRARLLGPARGRRRRWPSTCVAQPDATGAALGGELDAGGVGGRLADGGRRRCGRPGHRHGRSPRAGPDRSRSALRTAYRRELVAIAGRDLAGDLDLREVTEALADLAGHTLQAALAVAAAGLPGDAAPCRLAIIAMGKTGARELNYVSDVDVVFVGRARATADGDVERRRSATATTLAARRCGSAARSPGRSTPRCGPEGKDGPLVRTLASHEAYYRRWASTWEFQALLKARPVAGDAELGRALPAR